MTGQKGHQLELDKEYNATLMVTGDFKAQKWSFKFKPQNSKIVFTNPVEGTLNHSPCVGQTDSVKLFGIDKNNLLKNTNSTIPPYNVMENKTAFRLLRFLLRRFFRRRLL